MAADVSSLSFFFLHLYSCFSFHAWILLGDCVSVYFSGYWMIAQGLCSNTLDEWGFLSLSRDLSVTGELFQNSGQNSSQTCPDFFYFPISPFVSLMWAHRGVCVCVCVCVSGFILSQIWGLLRCSLFFSEYACGLVHTHSLPDSNWNMWELIKVIKSASFPGLPN